MYTTTTLIVWALLALITGFAAGWLVGLFRWKNSPAKAEAESAAIREDWQQTEKSFAERINEVTDTLKGLTARLNSIVERRDQEAQSEAPKKL